MLLSLTPSSTRRTTNEEKDDTITNPGMVGCKAASIAKLLAIPHLLSHVPTSYALTSDFFQPWVERLAASRKTSKFAEIVEECATIPLNADQQAALETLRTSALLARRDDGSMPLVAVRSSALEEDSNEQSFAGLFITKLGVTASTLEQAVRECFASRYDPRVTAYDSTFSYNSTTSTDHNNSFAVLVMEMVVSVTAGVAFSANPLNSDRDELVVDSSWGLGESVVDGSVSADRYVYDKVARNIKDKKIHSKTQEKKMDAINGGVTTRNIAEEKKGQSSLAESQLHELAEIVCLIEKEYGMPMDVEWAYYANESSDDETPVLKVLQARPITTLFSIDDAMMTKPSEKRILYYDYNITSDCTTITPFTHMDSEFYAWTSSAMVGFTRDIFTTDPNMPIFKASTRQ
jgi:phosphoenolpyruvate synthase/pyruvate phosphate dikinase